MKLQKELKDSGFVLLTNHVQRVDKDTVVGLLKQHKANFTVMSFGNVDVPNKGSGIPRAYLFDSKGNLVETGHPMALKDAAKALVRSEPHFLAAGRTYEKLGKIAASLKATRAYGSILKKLAKEQKKEGVAKEEADYLAGRIRQYGNRNAEEAKELEEEDAYAANALYEQISAMYKGDAIGDAAKARLKALKKDKAFQTELKAGKLAMQIESLIGQLVTPQGRSKPPLTSSSNKGFVTKIRGYGKVLGKKYPDAKATAAARKSAKSVGIEI